MNRTFFQVPAREVARYHSPYLPVQLQQCRNINLLCSALLKSPTGNHKIKAYRDLQSSFPAQHKIILAKDIRNFINPTRPENITQAKTTPLGIKGDFEQVSASTALQRVKPGIFLSCVTKIPKKGTSPITNDSLPLQFELVDIRESIKPTNINPSYAGKRAKLMHWQYYIEPWLFRDHMYKSYWLMKERLNVEFQIHCAKRAQALEYTLDHLLHLRPEFVAKAMPEFSGVIISPQTNGRNMFGWAMAPPVKSTGESGETILVKPPNRMVQWKKNRDIQLELEKEGKGVPATVSGRIKAKLKARREQKREVERRRAEWRKDVNELKAQVKGAKKLWASGPDRAKAAGLTQGLLNSMKTALKNLKFQKPRAVLPWEEKTLKPDLLQVLRKPERQRRAAKKVDRLKASKNAKTETQEDTAIQMDKPLRSLRERTSRKPLALPSLEAV